LFRSGSADDSSSFLLPIFIFFDAFQYNTLVSINTVATTALCHPYCQTSSRWATRKVKFVFKRAVISSRAADGGLLPPFILRLRKRILDGLEVAFHILLNIAVQIQNCASAVVNCRKTIGSGICGEVTRLYFNASSNYCKGPAMGISTVLTRNKDECYADGVTNAISPWRMSKSESLQLPVIQTFHRHGHGQSCPRKWMTESEPSLN
jgi:hypothetical protein